nr:immunoglobulin heavy chain junction region [Mus musculus]
CASFYYDYDTWFVYW